MNKIIYEGRLLFSEFLFYLILIIAPNEKEGIKLKKLILNYTEEKLNRITEV